MLFTRAFICIELSSRLLFSFSFVSPSRSLPLYKEESLRGFPIYFRTRTVLYSTLRDTEMGLYMEDIDITVLYPDISSLCLLVRTFRYNVRWLWILPFAVG